MTNKEAIKILTDARNMLIKANEICGMHDFAQAHEAYTLAIKALEEKIWIPTSERLPDKNMPCLVSVGYFNFTQIAMYSDLMGTINHKIFWQGDYGKNNFQNITEYVNAWQPLPKPYKKGGEER